MGGIHANQSLRKGLVVGLIRHRDLVWNKVGSRFRDSGFGVLGNWREPIGVEGLDLGSTSGVLGFGL